MLCGNEKVYEEQVVRMFRKALLERFRLTAQAIPDDVGSGDILSGSYENCGEHKLDFADGMTKFVGQMLERLSRMQRVDFIERDKEFLRQQVRKALADMENAQKEKDDEAAALAGEREKSWRERLSYIGRLLGRTGGVSYAQGAGNCMDAGASAGRRWIFYVFKWDDRSVCECVCPFCCGS